jgi:hypothetical protein
MPPKTYEIHVRGQVPAEVVDELGGLLLAAEDPQTVLRGPVRDQSSLHGILHRLANLGVELVEVRLLPDGRSGEGGLS